LRPNFVPSVSNQRRNIGHPDEGRPFPNAQSFVMCRKTPRAPVALRQTSIKGRFFVAQNDLALSAARRSKDTPAGFSKGRLARADSSSLRMTERPNFQLSTRHLRPLGTRHSARRWYNPRTARRGDAMARMFPERLPAEVESEAER